MLIYKNHICIFGATFTWLSVIYCIWNKIKEGTLPFSGHQNSKIDYAKKNQEQNN